MGRQLLHTPLPPCLFTKLHSEASLNFCQETHNLGDEDRSEILPTMLQHYELQFCDQQEAFEWRKEMERKQRSLLGKDESDQYLAGLEAKISKVYISVHIDDSI